MASSPTAVPTLRTPRPPRGSSPGGRGGGQTLHPRSDQRKRARRTGCRPRKGLSRWTLNGVWPELPPPVGPKHLPSGLHLLEPTGALSPGFLHGLPATGVPDPRLHPAAPSPRRDRAPTTKTIDPLFSHRTTLPPTLPPSFPFPSSSPSPTPHPPPLPSPSFLPSFPPFPPFHPFHPFHPIAHPVRNPTPYRHTPTLTSMSVEWGFD